MPKSHHEMDFYQWGKIYGDVIHLHVLGKSILVLNSATELLEKRSGINSGRPRFPLFEMLGWDPSLTMLDYGNQFQLHRKMLHQYLNREQCIEYRPIQKQNVHGLVHKLAANPEGSLETIERFATGNIIRIAYGHHIVSNDDGYYKIAHDATTALFESGPAGGTPLDIFPFLEHFPSWFPGTYYANYARDKRHLARTFHEAPVQKVQEQMRAENAEPSFAQSHLETMAREGSESRLTLHDIHGAASILHVVGTDTTTVTLTIFVLAMVLYPECQRKAQEELDAVLGPGRLPEFSDHVSLPFVECVWQETLRWHQAAPLGLPHVSAVDDVYNGMFIPKGTTILSNIRAMTLNDKLYHEPSKFIPERFLPKPAGDGEPLPPVFGFGRRICPGRHFADGTLWMAIATILATLTISKAFDKDGKEITAEVKFKSALLR
ncbi:hypothetical protein D9615_002768 [Tricholomella constricta]|uniref:Cytochrome P450 n=1 Tax=Tricholomella constricta TaxID=117010 RepID=A0A8H5HG32_9AGAR|nr:hypothetical protein D9615_002768 [Tricholomella constricta]